MTWVAVVAALVAVLAAMASYRAARRRGAAVAYRSPDGRDRAPMTLRVLDADARLHLAGDRSHYAVLLQVVNASPIPRTFAAVDLRVRYRTAANFVGAADVPLTAAPDPGGARTGEVTLRLPLIVEVEQSLIGWVHFVTGDVVPAGCRVDGYSIVMTGDAGEQLFADVPLTTVRGPREAVG